MSRVAIVHRLRVGPRPGGAAARGHHDRPAARELRHRDVQGRRRPVDRRSSGSGWSRPDAPFPTTAASSPGEFKEAYEAAFDGGRRGDRLDPRRGHPVGHDQERRDRARHAARPRDPRRRLARRVDGRGDPRAAWAWSWPPTGGRPPRSPRSLEAAGARHADVRRPRDARVPQEGRPDQRRPGGDRHAALGQADHRGQATAWSRRPTASGRGRRRASGSSS